MVPHRTVMAIVAVVDVALYARAEPVAAKAVAARNSLTPRHLEPVLQSLVHSGILKGVRGPRGGYELARERRRISAGDIARAVDRAAADREARLDDLLGAVIGPAIGDAVATFMTALDAITVDDLCHRAEQARIRGATPPAGEFHI